MLFFDTWLAIITLARAKAARNRTTAAPRCSSARCGHALPPVPHPRSPLGRAHRALASHARTGRPAPLRVARDTATELRATPGEPVDVLTGGWAGLLLEIECSRPALALAPGTADE